VLTKDQKAARVRKCLAWMVMPSSFPTRHYIHCTTNRNPGFICIVEKYSTRKISCEKVPESWSKASFEKRQVTSTFHRNEGQNQPRLLHRACFGESSVRICQKLVWRRQLCFQLDFAPPHKDIKLLVCNVTGS
jgi:hypothetical protein